jgi:tetratricopeptide (TPR) repeat protein
MNQNAQEPQRVMRAALAARDASRYEEGATLVRAALRMHPREAGLWQVLGLLHRAAEDSAAAIKAFEKAARFAPSDPKIGHARARVAMEAGLPAAALFDHAYALAPNDGDLLVSRAAARLAEGQSDRAIAELEELLARNPLWLEGHSALARIRWMSDDRDRFSAGYEHALLALPGNRRLWHAFLNALLEAEMYQAADRAVSRARAAIGNDPVLDAVGATCASELRDDVRADRLFDRVRPYTDIRVAVRHLRHLLRTGRPEAAAALAQPFTATEQAREVWPYVSLAWRLMGDPRSAWLDDPLFVAAYDIEGYRSLPRLARALHRLHTASAYPLGQSVRGGTQTDGPLFAHIGPEIRELRRQLKGAVEKHLGRLSGISVNHPYMLGAPERIRFAGSWSVRLSGGGHHTNHIHPQGWLSSAFYVQVPGAEELGPPPAGWLSIGLPPCELELDLPPLQTIRPEAGRLVVFPSLMWHGTMPFRGGERLTVAFDVAPA